MQRERETTMDQGKVKGRGFLAGRKIGPASPQEWDSEMEARRPPEWQKNPGGIAREWEGG